MPIIPIIDFRTNIPVFVTAPPNFPAGYNRNLDGDCILRANTDWYAVLEFLQEYSDKEHTYRSYAKELERFCLWLIHDLEKPLSDVRRPDWIAYCAFIEDPRPYDIWCNVKKRRFKGISPNPDWKPFEQRKDKPPVDEPAREMRWRYGLSSNCAKKAKKIIEYLYSYLVCSGYLAVNPVLMSRKRSRPYKNQRLVKERFLDADLIDFSIDTLYKSQLQAQVNTLSVFPYIRARYIIQLLAGTGLRIEEAANHTMGDIQCNKTDWTLNIIGKANEPRSIELLPDLKASIAEFRTEVGISSPTPLFKETIPLIPRKNLSSSIGPRRIDQILDWAFGLSVQRLINESKNYPKTDETHGELVRNASILERASAHYLRHSHTAFFLKHSNGDLKSTMDRLGHADISTTMLYEHRLSLKREAGYITGDILKRL